nr:ABC transporter substrate-binding protein [Burkholderiaceae bacterium]
MATSKLRAVTRFGLAAALAAAALLGAGGTLAKTFKFANQGDVVSMDPHSLNESFLLNFMGNVYE